ncbi:hypothetical protein IQ13_1029 [Lacibacter cauensis]|uniref:HNH endonuclease n=1 Tax=Lacibacter cauensis TaxID=510947 RepID=A0A562SZ09_9BACT|nr:hypothetical protein [Lacibacter cauensis]TWI85860.1 hypothetical protein IQ13_1029 [Lacibacter cauensis]
MSEIIDVTLTPHESYLDLYKDFYEKYELLDMVFPEDPRFSKKNLKPKANRQCRFCGLKFPEVSFKSYSHLLSELIGNKDLFTDFECDICNNKFSKLENDLASFLGISRTIQRVSSKKGVPGFKSAGKKLKAKSKSYLGNDFVVISTDDFENNVIDVSDREKGIINVKYIKNPYTPLSVYKVLLKWGLSLFNEKLLPFYKYAFMFLNNAVDLKGAAVYGYRLPFHANLLPRAYIFQKRDLTSSNFTHVIAFGFQNYFICIPMPLCANDFKLNGTEVKLAACPPLFTQFEPYSNAEVAPFIEQMESNLQVKDVEESFFFQIDPEQLSRSAAYDYNTDTHLEGVYKPEKLKALVFMRDGIEFGKDEIRDFVQSILEDQ